MRSRPLPRGSSPDLPPLLFIERVALAEPVSVEVDRPDALRPQPVGFWRGRQFSRVVKIVETRFEYGEMFLRVVTDRGCIDVRRYRATDPRTLRSRPAWEICAELDAIEIPRPR